MTGEIRWCLGVAPLLRAVCLKSSQCWLQYIRRFGNTKNIGLRVMLLPYAISGLLSAAVAYQTASRSSRCRALTSTRHAFCAVQNKHSVCVIVVSHLK